MEIMIKQINNSSSVKAIGYDAVSNVLMVEFIQGKQYVYMNVPPELWDEMQQAPSVGKFIAQRVKYIYEYKLLPKA